MYVLWRAFLLGVLQPQESAQPQVPFQAQPPTQGLGLRQMRGGAPISGAPPPFHCYPDGDQGAATGHRSSQAIIFLIKGLLDSLNLRWQSLGL